MVHDRQNMPARPHHLARFAGLEDSLSYITQLSAKEFYGTVELRFEAGRIVLLVEHRSIKPETLQLSEHLRLENEEKSKQ
jgi:hypothetical protein